MTDLTTRWVPERQEPDKPPDLVDLADPGGEPHPDPPSSAGAVELSRLLALARLTAAQALEVAAGLLAAAVAGSDGDHPLVDALVAPDGRVVLRPAANGRPSGRPAAAVLADVVAAVPPPGPLAPPAEEQRRSALDRAVQDLPTAGVPVVAMRLQEPAAGIDRPAVRAELAALVRAVGGLGGAGSGVPRTGEPRGAARGGRAGAARPRQVELAPGRTWSTGRRIGAWLLSLLVLGAAVTSEVVLLRDDITADVDLLLKAGRGGEEPSTAVEPEPDGAYLPPQAPASAGNVASVDLRPLAPCATGAPCAVRILVRLVPAAEPQVVTWSYQVVERCAGTSGTVPGGTVTVPARADRAAAVGTVALPPAAGVTVVAVTDAPAVAASAPVVIGSCQPAGPGA